MSTGTGGAGILYSTKLGISLTGRHKPKPRESAPEKSVNNALSAVKIILGISPKAGKWTVLTMRNTLYVISSDSNGGLMSSMVAALVL